MDFLMNQLTKGAKSSRGGELSIAALVSLLDIATTNNTRSIIAAGPIARDIAEEDDEKTTTITFKLFMI